MSTVSGGAASLLASACEVRRAAAGDRPALERMLARCTGETRYRRFHGYVNLFPEPYLTEALSGSPLHFALVACAAAGEIDDTVVDDTVVDDTLVALASCRAVAEGVAELGVLVEDAWQRHGVGAQLFREIVGYASRTGLRALQAQVLGDQSWIVGVLRRYGPCEVVAARGTLTMTLTLPRYSASGAPSLSGTSA
jgi:GNAT superfamily N-acetyltransferase